MGVIVNELEVITEPPPAGAADEAASAAATTSAPQPSAGPTPDDVRRIVRHWEMRRRRVWAH